MLVLLTKKIIIVDSSNNVFILLVLELKFFLSYHLRTNSAFNPEVVVVFSTMLHRTVSNDNSSSAGIPLCPTIKDPSAVRLSSLLHLNADNHSFAFMAADDILQDTSHTTFDPKRFKAHLEQADDAVDKLIKIQEQHNQADSGEISRFGFDEVETLIRNDSMNEFATIMNSHQIVTSFTDLILETHAFPDCLKLTHCQPEMLQ